MGVASAGHRSWTTACLPQRPPHDQGGTPRSTHITRLRPSFISRSPSAVVGDHGEALRQFRRRDDGVPRAERAHADSQRRSAAGRSWAMTVLSADFTVPLPVLSSECQTIRRHATHRLGGAWLLLNRYRRGAVRGVPERPINLRWLATVAAAADRPALGTTGRSVGSSSPGRDPLTEQSTWARAFVAVWPSQMRCHRKPALFVLG
jgi:hypothetical protein